MARKPAVLGLLFEGLNPSAALVKDGTIAAIAEEERFTRVKHAPDAFPAGSVEYCLREGGVSIADVDYISVGWDAHKFPAHMEEFFLACRRMYRPCSRFVLNWQERKLSRYTAENLETQIRERLLRNVPESRAPEIRFVNHHFAHACSCFMPSGFDDAAIITADGHGEDDCTNFWAAEKGRINHLKQWKIPHSLGWFYTKFTQWFGFQPHDGEGKLMGLAAYGSRRPELIEKVNRVLFLTGDDDVYRVNPRFFFGEFVECGPYTHEWIQLFGEPRTQNSSEPFSEYHMDLAFAVQDALE
ncbi:MAG: carbamoyltransferase N-terminal domain-containing protein, partial [bacterium]